MKKLQSIFTIIFLLVLGSTQVNAQSSKQQKQNQKEQKINELINSRRYSFIPQTVLPTRGPSKTLTSDYELKIKNDTLESYLPYFGRAYSASIAATQSPLDFKTTYFTYTIANHKNGGWDITIKTKNDADPRQFMLSVSKNGYASLQVISANRDPISFNGHIQ